MLQKKILFFYSGNNPYRISRLKEASEQAGVDYEFIDLDKILFNNGLIESPIFLKKEFNYTGYFLGYSEISKYVIKALEGKIIFPQKVSWELADKFNSHIFLKRIGIATPPSALILSSNSIDELAETIGGFPCIIKKTTGGNGSLVEMVNSKKECLEFIMTAKEKITLEKVFPRAFCFLLQKPIKESYGTDYRALCIGNKFLGIMKRTAKSEGSFKANFSLGGEVKEISEIREIREMSEKIMRKSKLFMAGIDFIKSNEGYQVLEINTSPQFKGFEQATGEDVAGNIVNRLVQIDN